jgi:hypothetical protein
VRFLHLNVFILFLQRLQASERAGLLWAPHANSGVSHDRERAREVCCAIGEHLNGNRNLPLSRESGQAQEHDTWVRLPTSEHKLAKVFAFGDQDYGLAVCQCEYVKVGRAKR